jgi:hypothetical protein
MRGAIVWRLPRPFQHLCAQLRGELLRWLAGMNRRQTQNALLWEALARTSCHDDASGYKVALSDPVLWSVGSGNTLGTEWELSYHCCFRLRRKNVCRAMILIAS